MSQNIRPTPDASGRQGSVAKVDASGIAIMSDSSIALKPVIDEPSKPIPPSKASSSSSALIEKLLSCPRMSVNQSRMKRISWSLTSALTSSAVFGWSAIGLLRGIGVGGEARKANEAGAAGLKRRALEPLVGPRLERADRRLQRAALVGHRVLHADRGAVEHAPLHDPLGLELLQPLRQETVGYLG